MTTTDPPGKGRSGDRHFVKTTTIPFGKLSFRLVPAMLEHFPVRRCRYSPHLFSTRASAAGQWMEDEASMGLAVIPQQTSGRMKTVRNVRQVPVSRGQRLGSKWIAPVPCLTGFQHDRPSILRLTVVHAGRAVPGDVGDLPCRRSPESKISHLQLRRRSALLTVKPREAVGQNSLTV